MRWTWLPILVLLAGCAVDLGMARDDPNQVIIRDPKQRPVPIDDVEAEAISPTLQGFWQYGLLSAAAYEPSRATLAGLCPQPSRYVARWAKDTRFNHHAFPPIRSQSFGIRIPGLEYSVWEDISRRQRKRVAIVFRGTDFTQFGDWYSNFRWITRLNPTTWDQYQQVRDLARPLVKALQDNYGADVEIVATGHSLGAGLAQHAAYTSPVIKTVYAFAPSPVTAVSSIDKRVDPMGVMTLRVYESGEVLSALRWVARRFAPLTRKNPLLNEARFNFRQSLNREHRGNGPISQHNIQQFSCDLICRVENRRSSEECMTRALVNLKRR